MIVQIPGAAGPQDSSDLSFTNTLTQSLRTEDSELLESCLNVRDTDRIQSSVANLDVPAAVLLLQRLAKMLNASAARAGSLLSWIQWTLIFHGSYLSREPSLHEQLSSLLDVAQQRAKNLDSLLSLKGKLDLLEAQLYHRKQNERSIVTSSGVSQGLIFIEGTREEEGSAQISAKALRNLRQDETIQNESEAIDDDSSRSAMDSSLSDTSSSSS